MPADPPDGFEHDRGRACARAPRRQRDDRPHLAGRRDPQGLARGPLPDRARRRAPRLQLLRVAPRQPRGDDARHVRERAAAQPAGARHRGRRDREGRRARPRSTTPRWSTPTRACRSACSRARSTAPAPRATGPPRARACSACASCSPESYERIHRSNLVGMGVLPLQFPDGESVESLGLTGFERFDLAPLEDGRAHAARSRPRPTTASRSRSTRACGSTPRTSGCTSAAAASSTTCCASCVRADSRSATTRSSTTTGISRPPARPW